MAQYQITLDETLLHQLFVGNSRDAGIAALLETILNQVLNSQASEQLSAEKYERTEERQGYRNGSYARSLTTRVGSITLQVPRLRDGKFCTDLFARYQRSEQALLLSLMEMVVNGVSTRKVSRVTEELCGAEFSKSTVSELCKQLDPAIQAWNERSLEGKAYPFLAVDAMYVKVREDGKIRSRGVLIATGISADGDREILGMMVGDTESEASWGAFFTLLKQRGVHGVDLITSDHHGGLVQAIRQHFQGATWQRCQTHFIRNVLDAAPKALQGQIKASVRSIFEAPNVETARAYLKQALEAYEATAAKSMKVLEDGFDDSTAVLEYPEEYRIRLRTTNNVERINEEIRRREHVIRIFPNRASVMRLIGAVLMEMEDEWRSRRRYIDMTNYHEWLKTRTHSMTYRN